MTAVFILGDVLIVQHVLYVLHVSFVEIKTLNENDYKI